MYVRGMGCDRHLFPVLNTDAVYVRMYLKVSKVPKPRMEGGRYMGMIKEKGKFNRLEHAYIHTYMYNIRDERVFHPYTYLVPIINEIGIL